MTRTTHTDTRTDLKTAPKTRTAKPSAFDKIAAGLNDAIAFAKGEGDPTTYVVHVPPSIDVEAIRKRRGLTQPAFANRYGFSVGAVRDWEQRRKTPEGPSRAYLLVIDREPEAVDRALATVAN